MKKEDRPAVRMDPELHVKLKVYAAERRTSVKELVEEAIDKQYGIRKKGGTS